MPTYDYRCTQCQETFEVFHGITEAPEVFCPSCQAEAKKLISAGAGILFKGSGFYVTDYKNNQGGSQKTEPSSTKTQEKTPCGTNCACATESAL